MNNVFDDSRFFHNNFINNSLVHLTSSETCSWDNGYPSGGNYWSNYVGADIFCGASQDETGSDNIGDSPYVIDANNVDNYPLMRPFVPFENQTIYIRADGSVDPSGAPILRKGDVYTLTSSITSNATNGIVVEKDNIVVDGSGFSIEGLPAFSWHGISLVGRSSVTIQNTDIKNFYYGVVLNSSSSNSINVNTITNNSYGIVVTSFSNNNSISGNTITGSEYDGIWLFRAPNNTVCHNNLINNAIQVNDHTPEYANFWDNGCEGNCWSDYSGTDSNNDGIGDTPYVINSNNTDNYPLMNIYWSPCDINHDLKIDMKDIGAAARAFYTRPGDEFWNPHADITGSQKLVPDGKVDLKDIGFIARHFMDHYP
jgi:parallel beta-helix repeat protein